MNHSFPMKYPCLPCLLLTFCAAFLIACGSSSSGGGGGGAGNGNGDGYGDPDPDPDPGAMEATLASIQEHVFSPQCSSCHGASLAEEGLRLDSGQSHGHLVDVASEQVPELMRVEPGNPNDSYLIHKLEGTQDVGERMPKEGCCLSQSDINVIRQWISDGAESGSQGSEVAASARVSGGWPMDGTSVSTPPGSIVVIFDQELDTTLLHAGSISLSRFDDSQPDGPRMQALQNTQMRVTSLAPTTIVLTVPDDAWAPGHYELRVRGTGTAPVATRYGEIIDGDGDGQPGGDYRRYFEVRSGK